MALEGIGMPSLDSLDPMALMAKNAPIYVQIRERLRHQILAGTYKAGDRIASEDDIAESFRVNRLTARRAVSDLVAEGLLLRRPGIGTFVIGRKFLRNPGSLSSFWEATAALGMRPSSLLAGKETIPAPGDIAELLEIPEEQPIYRIRRVRLADGEPLAYHIAHVPARLFSSLMKEDLANQSLYALYRRYGYAPAGGEQSIEARSVEAEVAKLLSLPVGSPVLYLQRITRSADGKPIEVVLAYVRSDAYVIHMPLHP